MVQSVATFTNFQLQMSRIFKVQIKKTHLHAQKNRHGTPKFWHRADDFWHGTPNFYRVNRAVQNLLRHQYRKF